MAVIPEDLQSKINVENLNKEEHEQDDVSIDQNSPDSTTELSKSFLNNNSLSTTTNTNINNKQSNFSQKMELDPDFPNLEIYSNNSNSEVSIQNQQQQNSIMDNESIHLASENNMQGSFSRPNRFEQDPDFPSLDSFRNQRTASTTNAESLKEPRLEHDPDFPSFDNVQKLPIVDNDQHKQFNGMELDPDFPSFDSVQKTPIQQNQHHDNADLGTDLSTAKHKSPSPATADNSKDNETSASINNNANSYESQVPTLSEIVPRPQNSSLPAFKAKTFSGRSINIYKILNPPTSNLSSNNNNNNNNSSSTSNSEQDSQSSRLPVHIKKAMLSNSSKPMWKIIAEHEERKKQKEKGKAPETDSSVQENENATSVKLSKATRLLTDIYRPRKFINLMGDERSNRAAMSWLKEWDECVFKRTPSTMRKRRKLDNNDSISQGEFKPRDPLGRPEYKVLLLTGPPGLGKTTMAHVMARQAGYQVLEINASDERSTNVVTNKIREAVESQGLNQSGDSRAKPFCVIIDEIDGTSGDQGFMRALIHLINDGGTVRKSRGNSKRKEHRPLSRPIICICNDLYAPSLRTLRPMAKIIRLRPLVANHLIKRLKEICDIEKIPNDSKGLTKLVELAQGDMRTCLNTLQFIKSKGGQADERTMSSPQVATRDSNTTANYIWKTLLKPIAGERYVNRLADEISTCGEYDKIAHGCFESYLAFKPPNDPFKAIQKALSWLYSLDLLDSKLRADRNFELTAYLPYMFVAWNPLFANVANQPVEWPKADFENYQRQTAHSEIATTFSQSIPAYLKALFRKNTISIEFIPLLLRILNPDLRPINNELIKPQEKQLLSKIVVMMSDMNITFTEERNEDGQLIYKMEPPIDTFVHYEGKLSSDMNKSRYSLRQLITQELEKVAAQKRQDLSDNADGQGYEGSSSVPEPERRQPGKDGPAVDFFGRPIEKEGQSNDQEQEHEQERKISVMFKYHEGFSNAVKVPLKVADFFR